MRKQSSTRVPAFSARSAAAWMTGPSAIGSENGMPTSIMSAPPSTSASSKPDVAAARQIDDDDYLVPGRFRHPQRLRNRMGGFESGDDPFGASQSTERIERLSVLNSNILGAADVLEMGMLGADGRIVESGRDRPGIADLSIGILKHQGFGAMQDSMAALLKGRAVLMARQPFSGRLHANQCDVFVPDEVGEYADRIGAAADAGDNCVGKPALDLQYLRPGFLADYPLILADHQRKGMRTGGRPEQIMGGRKAPAPLPNRLVDCVLD